ncbi:phosphoglyceromutase [Nannochloropsis oceanica]
MCLVLLVSTTTSTTTLRGMTYPAAKPSGRRRRRPPSSFSSSTSSSSYYWLLPTFIIFPSAAAAMASAATNGASFFSTCAAFLPNPSLSSWRQASPSQTHPFSSFSASRTTFSSSSCSTSCRTITSSSSSSTTVLSFSPLSSSNPPLSSSSSSSPSPPRRPPTPVVFVRHGQSDFNRQEIFTGWCDVDVNKKGEDECKEAGMLLASRGFTFDIAYTSVLKRAVKSLWCCLDGCDHTFIPIKMHWRLNERHYGAMQGLSKEESEKKLGPIVKLWRRSWRGKPPDMPPSHPHYPLIRGDRRYKDVADSVLPKGESLEMCAERVMVYWEEEVLPSIRRGERPLVVAHANSLRSLIKRLDGLGEEQVEKGRQEGGRKGGKEQSIEVIEDVKIPNGRPFVYWFDEEGVVVDREGRRGGEGRFRGVFIREEGEKEGGDLREGGREGGEEEGHRKWRELFALEEEEEEKEEKEKGEGEGEDEEGKEGAESGRARLSRGISWNTKPRMDVDVQTGRG